MEGYTPIPKLQVLNMGTENQGDLIPLFNDTGKLVGYSDKNKFSNNRSLITYQDDSLIVKFDNNYQKFSLEEPFNPRAVFDEETQVLITTKLDIDFTEAILGSSVQIYVTGEAPFTEYEEVHYNNIGIYKNNIVNLIILDYKSNTDITAVVVNNAPTEIEIPLEPIFHITNLDFLEEVKFDKKYEIGSYTDRVSLFSIDNSDAVAGTEVKVFYNGVTLPEADIKWINELEFESNTNCLICLYKTSTGEIIGKIYKI